MNGSWHGERELRGQFSEKELSTLTSRVMGINAWNRLNVAFRTPPGALDKAFGLDKAGLVRERVGQCARCEGTR